MIKSNKLNLAIKAGFYLTVVIITLISAFQFINDDNANLGMNLGIVLIIIAAAAILLFSVYQLIDNPKKSLISLLGLAGIIVIFLIAYSSSSGADTFGKTTEATAKFVGGALGLLYILGIVTVLSILISEIWSFFK